MYEYLPFSYLKLAEKIIAISVQWVVVVVVQVTARGRRGPEGAHHRRLLTPDSTDPLHTRQQPGKPTPALIHGIKSWAIGHQQNISLSLSVSFSWI